MENLNIKYAIEFLKNMGYSWNGEIVGKDIIPETIYDFDCPQIVNLNGEEKGLILYNEQDSSPECLIYWFEKNGDSHNFVTEMDLTQEWIEFLNQKKL